jgi:hypothetical protein
MPIRHSALSLAHRKHSTSDNYYYYQEALITYAIIQKKEDNWKLYLAGTVS